MIQLEIFFKNHLDTNDVSDDNMNRFGQDSLQRLTANNPGGIYTTLITATSAAYNNFFNAINTEAHNQSLQESATVNVDNYQKEFIDLVAMKEGIIRGTLGQAISTLTRNFFRAEWKNTTKIL